MNSTRVTNINLQFNINICGRGTKPMLFAHGYGCDQNMFRLLYPHFEEDYKIVLFDYIGAGKSDLTAYNKHKYNSLNGYAEDVLTICEHLSLTDIIYVGHSVSAMIGVLASIQKPSVFAKLIMICPSPRYINDGNYIGGFDEAAIEELLQSLEHNYLGWSQSMAPLIMGNEDRPELGQELSGSFCTTNPSIAKNFARTIFLSDNREDLAKVTVPSLIIQAKRDVLAPIAVGEYTAKAISKGTLKIIEATGHCPNLSAPEETAKAIKDYL